MDAPSTIPVSALPETVKVEPKFHWKGKLIFITISIFIIGVVILIGTGESLIKESTQEVIINSNETVSLSIGKEAPNFELNDIKGNKVKRSDFLDSPLVIMFWTTWNTASVDQIKILDDYLSQKGDKPFKVVMINNQEKSSYVRDFIKRGGYEIQVLLDEKGEVGEMYQVKTLPVFYFLDGNGIIKNLHIGPLSQDDILLKAEPALITN